MTGTITFPLPSGIAKFALDSIYNVHTDGSGVLTFNVIAATTEFTFTCEDEAAAVRIAETIFTLKTAGSDFDFVVGYNVNYPLPPIPVIDAVTIGYDYLENKWFAEAYGTALDSTATVIFAGVPRSLASITPTKIKTEWIDKPAYGVLEMDFIDSRGNFLTSATKGFYYTVTTFVPNPFVGGTDSFVVNGSDFDNSLLGKVRIEEWNDTAYLSFYVDPVVFTSQFQLSCTAANWHAGDGVFIAPMCLFYIDSGGKESNRVYIASVT